MKKGIPEDVLSLSYHRIMQLKLWYWIILILSLLDFDFASVGTISTSVNDIVKQRIYFSFKRDMTES